MIPKVIHYCWLSKDPIPQNLQDCMASWKRYLPDYEFILWNFDRFDKKSSIWVKEAFKKKKYAFAADYIRLYAIFNYGGFYLDMDVEVLKSFNDLLNLKTAISWQKECDGFEVAAFGAEKGCQWIKHCLDYYENRHFKLPKGQIDNKPLPNIVEDIIKEKNYNIKTYSNISTLQEMDNTFPVLSDDFFSPKSYITKEIHITPNTYTIHHFAGSWVNEDDNKPFIERFWKRYHLPNTNIRLKLKKLFHL